MSETESQIKVVIRTRPTQVFASKNISISSIDNKINITIPRNESKGIINNQKENWSFQFDKILHNVAQEEVFEYVKSVISVSTRGFNGTVFAYGPTGSGKTFTMSGSSSNFNYRGIIPRSITRLFQELGGKIDFDSKVSISYLEIYNEIIFDLLSPVPANEQKGEINFQEDAKGNVVVKGLTKHVVANEEEAFNLLFEGESNRTVSEHQLNKASTRSHCIFTISIEMKSKVESSEKVLTSKLNFVDLAGSERVKETGSSGLALKEAAYINKSLTFLEQVVVALTDKTKRKEYVPYRQSKLTHILKDAIGGNCKTIMIATIWPEEQFILDTLSTLNFAKRMKNVVNDLSVNIMLDKNAYVKKLNKEIKELKKELLMHNTLANRGKINYDPYTPEEQYLQQQIALKFLNGENEDIEFDSIRQAKELFIQCRIIFQKEYNGTKMEDESQAAIERKKTLIEKEREKTLIDNEKGVGDFEEKPSFGIGRAPKDARPIYKLEQTNANIQSPGINTLMKSGELKNLNSGDVANTMNDKTGNNINMIQGQSDADVVLDGEDNEKFEEDEEIPPERIPDKNTGFQIYKSENEKAKQIEESIINTTTELKKLKDEARTLGEEGNKYKEQIDNIQSALKNKQQNKLNLADEMTNVIDDEECKLIDQLKDIRKNYKETVEKFKQTKVAINELKNNLDLLKIKYVDSFENWFYKKYHIRVEEHELRLAKAKYGVNAKEETMKEKINDPEEEAYNNAKKKIQSIHKAKRMEKKIS
jgi:kinesin family protein 6/9